MSNYSSTTSTTAETSRVSVFTAYAAVVTTVIGGGIFFKNSSVFKVAGFNIFAILAAWLLVGFICLCTSYVYSKFSSSPDIKSEKIGYAGWAKSLVGPHLSVFFNKVFIFFKLGIAIPGYCFYVGIFFLRIIKDVFQSGETNHILNDGLGAYTTVLFITLIGIMMLAGIMYFNYKHQEASLETQKTFLWLKFAPILMLIVFGIIGVCLRDGSNNLFSIWSSGNLTESGSSSTSSSSSTNLFQAFSVPNILMACPGIMLSFDGFLNSGFYSKKISDPKKQLPKLFVSVIATVCFVYLLITCIQAFNNAGVFYKVFDEETFGHAGSLSLMTMCYLLVLISIIGMINGYATTALPLINEAYEEKLFSVFYLIEKKRYSYKQKLMIFWVGITAFWTSIMLIFSWIQNGDAIFDGVTNVPVVILFSCYGILPLYYAVHLYKKEESRWNKENYIIYAASMISFFGWVLIAAWQFISIAFYIPIANGMTGEFTKWDGQASGGKNFGLKNWHASLLVIISFLTLFLGHKLDEYFKGKCASKEVLMIQETNI